MALRRSLIRVYSYHDNRRPIPNQWNFDLLHHPGVAPEASVNNQYYALCQGSDTDLLTYINQTRHVAGFEKPLLIQLMYAIRHIHLADKVLMPLREGNANILYANNIRFSEGEKSVVLHDFIFAAEHGSHTKQKNIAELATLVYLILGGNGAIPASIQPSKVNPSCEPDLAVDMLHTMRLGCSVDDVLKHPYFWSTMKKLDFMSSLHQCLKSNKALINTFEKVPCFDSNNWLDQLRVGADQDGNAVRDAMYELATDPRLAVWSIKYDGRYSYSLLSFVRNCTAHFWDYDVKHRNARRALNNGLNGLWNFFNGKFPNLFIRVYKFVRQIPDITRELSPVYFVELAKTTDLACRR